MLLNTKDNTGVRPRLLRYLQEINICRHQNPPDQ
jgi:hypothetical protein